MVVSGGSVLVRRFSAMRAVSLRRRVFHGLDPDLVWRIAPIPFGCTEISFVLWFVGDESRPEPECEIEPDPWSEEPIPW